MITDRSNARIVEMMIFGMIAKQCPDIQLGDRLPNYQAVVSNGKVSNVSIDGQPVEAVRTVSRMVKLPLDEKDFEDIEIAGKFIHPFDCHVNLSIETFEERAIIRYAISGTS
jgi:hypothetical protein